MSTGKFTKIKWGDGLTATDEGGGVVRVDGMAGVAGPTGPAGPTGATGAAGADGADGADGVGVPTGGTTGQVLAKNSSTNYDTGWVTPTGGSGGVGADGWIDDTAETWTYVSASSFKITGTNVTAKYTPGTRVKLTQTTVKYFVVTSSSFSTDTTVNITAGSDYTLSNAAVSANFHSYELNPQGYPGWFNWTPTYTGFSADPTPSLAHFAVNGRICFVEYAESALGTSNVATFTITLPIACAQNNALIMCRVSDNGAAVAQPGRGVTLAASTTLTMGKTLTANGGFTTSGGKGALITGFYEI